MATFCLPIIPQCLPFSPFPIFRNDVPNHAGARKTLKLISWCPPSPGWVKLNTDGAYKKSIDVATAGGLIRDSLGRWLGGFAFHIGSVTSLQAEYTGILCGLELAWGMGFRQVVLESDCKVAIDHLINTNGIDSDDFVVQSVKELLARDWLVVLQHQYREGNQAADWLANAAVHMPPGCHELQFPPEIADILMQDISGLKFARLCGSS